MSATTTTATSEAVSEREFNSEDLFYLRHLLFKEREMYLRLYTNLPSMSNSEDQRRVAKELYKEVGKINEILEKFEEEADQ
jgi:hypothetical protein